MNILVVGGAGYIGSSVVKLLSRKGYQTITYDNLSRGHRDLVKWGIFVQGDSSDSGSLEEIFQKYHFSAVMHFAAFAYVGESVNNPALYYQNNLVNCLNLLNLCLRHRVNSFIFSSTCATYGNPLKIPLRETNPQNPINPYGRSKLMIEKVLKDYDRAYNLKSICLRYFNAAGADPEGETGEDHRPETHLIPLVLAVALAKRPEVKIFGVDYDTEDGTCIRDYIHVTDLASAHVLSLEMLLQEKKSAVFNLGNGKGFSVKEVIKTAEQITKKKIKTKPAPRRTGDPPVLVANSEKIRKNLSWQPKFSDLETIIETAYHWQKKRCGL